MTKYEALKILQEVVNFHNDRLRGHPSIYSIAEAVEVICDIILEEPSLPLNLDEAANDFERMAMEDYDEVCVTSDGTETPIVKHDFQDAFKAGAEWMSRQKEQKPAEWSEEDTLYLNVCKNALLLYDRTHHWDAHTIYSWLEKRLKPPRKGNG